MATITIEIDSEKLAREFLNRLRYLPSDDDIPDLVSVKEHQPALVEKTSTSEKYIVTHQDVFDFLQSKGKTLEEACKNDQELGDFLATFNVDPKKRIDGVLEPAGESIGTDLECEQDSFDVKNACFEQASKEREVFMKNEDEIRETAMVFRDEMDRFQFLIGMTDCESRVKRDVALNLVCEFLANRNLDPTLISMLEAKNVKFLHKLYEHKETHFLLKFKKENGV